nr:hypothetical protein [Tanacetum cinerariifolium]
MSEAKVSGSIVNEYLTKIKDGIGPGIVKPLFKENIKFEFLGQSIEELKENMFYEKEHEDPHEYISNIFDIIDLFHSYLKEKAKQWMKQLSPGSITTWDFLKTAFLDEYHPPLKIIKQIDTIRNFTQEPNEPLHQSWERSTKSLFNFPEHKLNKHEQLRIFYQGLEAETKYKVDFKGSIPKMTPTKGIKSIKELSKHSFSRYKEGNIKVNNKELHVVLKQTNNFDNNMNIMAEEVQMAQHRYETPMEERILNLEETLNSFIYESLIRQRESDNMFEE